MHDSVVFFGSGPVAAESLRLLTADFTIEAVITKTQPAHHKEPFPVLELAQALGLKTFTPSGKTELSELFMTNPVTSRLGIVIDYGFIINQDVIDYFPLGIVNSHFSLLPEWRGADPITFSILSGQEQTGVSLMIINAAMDEGDLLEQGVLTIAPEDTTPSLTSKLIALSNTLLTQSLPRYVSGELRPFPQEGEATYSRKLTKQDGIIDWTKPATQLEREIRAFIEWPKSRTQLAGKDTIITRAHAVTSEPAGAHPGDIDVVEGSKEFGVVTGNGTLWIDSLKPAGKNEMDAASFLAGYGNLLKQK